MAERMKRKSSEDEKKKLRAIKKWQERNKDRELFERIATPLNMDNPDDVLLLVRGMGAPLLTLVDVWRRPKETKED